MSDLEYYPLMTKEDICEEPDAVCSFGSFGYHNAGIEYCDFVCKLREACEEHTNAMPDCKGKIRGIEEKEHWLVLSTYCPYYHMGKCFWDYHFEFSVLRSKFRRFKCRIGFLPLRDSYGEEEK